MSNSLAPSGIVAKLIDIGARCGNAAGKRLALIAAVLPALVVCNVAMAQVGGMASPTPAIGATSPLGLETGSAVSPTGIPLGSTEITSAGVSPAPIGVTGTITTPTTGSGTACSTLATSPSQMFGSTATFDGGGTAVGASAPAAAVDPGILATSGTSTSPGMSTSSGMLDTSGMSGMCGSGSSSIAASSSPTSTLPTTPGGGARTGLPLGSFEIGNLGVSSAAAVPTISVLPTVGAMGSSAPLVPTIPTVASPPAVSSMTASTSSGRNALSVIDPSGSTLTPTGAGSD
ncbi:hypothetical protein SAMN05444158_6548 [Bradyrhizobium canariense]|uniref:Uncharacterized protein n=1 Tax=Bradyrhizobium canariense TaxID=255045 RepID=A0A1H2AWF2_9BRAD|nr:hypothetical protein SAMN05444158_6548 [Bradyrhizobium canariense]